MWAEDGWQTEPPLSRDPEEQTFVGKSQASREVGESEVAFELIRSTLESESEKILLLWLRFFRESFEIWCSDQGYRGDLFRVAEV